MILIHSLETETPIEAQASSSTITLGALEWAVILGAVAAFASIGMIVGRRHCISRQRHNEESEEDSSSNGFDSDVQCDIRGNVE